MSVTLDCGASSLITMKRFGVAPTDVAAVVLSHLHGDHFGGLPSSSSTVSSRAGPRR